MSVIDFFEPKVRDAQWYSSTSAKNYQAAYRLGAGGGLALLAGVFVSFCSSAFEDAFYANALLAVGIVVAGFLYNLYQATRREGKSFDLN